MERREEITYSLHNQLVQSKYFRLRAEELQWVGCQCWLLIVHSFLWKAQVHVSLGLLKNKHLAPLV